MVASFSYASPPVEPLYVSTSELIMRLFLATFEKVTEFLTMSTGWLTTLCMDAMVLTRSSMSSTDGSGWSLDVTSSGRLTSYSSMKV